MSTAAEDADESTPLSEVVKEPPRKPPLGPPHDAYASLGIVLFITTTLFFMGWSRTDPEWVSWTGLGISVGLLMTSWIYFVRAYGFPSNSLYQHSSGFPVFAYLGVFIGAFGLINYVVPTIHNQVIGEGPWGLLFTYFTLALLIVAPTRLALGQAPAPHDRSA